MIRKPKKNQIIKKVFLEEGFVDSDNLYFPIEISNADAESFRVNKICVSIIPQYFLIPNSNESISNTELEYNNGYRYVDKPFYINNSSKNLTSLDASSLEENFRLSNNLFSNIYARNLVSSYGQSQFLEDVISYFPSNNESNKILLKVDINKINETTSTRRIIQQGIGSPNREVVNYYEFLVKVYTLNENDELIDFINVKSKKISEYQELVSNENNIELIRRQSLSLFAESFDIRFNPYNFPVFEQFRLQNLGGIFFNFNRDYLRLIFDDNQNESIIISAFFENNESDYFELINVSRESLQEINDNFIETVPYRLIQSETFFEFISQVYRHISQKNKDDVVLNLTFTTTNSNGRSITLSKNKILDSNVIQQANEDFLKYKLQNNITNQRVINFKLTKSLVTNSSNLYKLDIILNSQEFLVNDIINGRLKFTFVTSGGFSYSPTIFYFDSQLSEGNNTLIDSTQKISNYMFNTNSLSIYFNTELDIGSFFVQYLKDDLSGAFGIGPIVIENEASNNSRINENVFDEAVSQISSSIVHSVDLKSYVFNSLNNVRSQAEDFIIDVSNIIRNINYVNLGYFVDSSISTEESLREIINNVLVKFSKKIIINGFTLFSGSNYDILNNVTVSTNFNSQDEKYKLKIKNSFLEAPLSRIDINNELSNNLQLLNDVTNFQSLNFENITSNFDITIEDNISFIIMKNNTVSKFGTSEDITQSKINLIDFIIANSSNFEVTTMENLLSFIYDPVFFREKNRYLRTIFRLSSLDIKKDFTSINRIDKTAYLSVVDDNDNDSLIDNIFSRENLTNLLYETNINCQNSLKLDFSKNNIVLLNTSSNDISFDISGRFIDKFISRYSSDRNNNFISKAFVYPVFTFDKNITSLKSGKSYVKENGFLISSNDNEIYLSYSKDLIDSFSENLNAKIESKKILLKFYQNEVFFRSIDNEFYHFASSLISQTNSSISSNNIESFIIKKIILRICIIINMTGKSYLVVKNLELKNTSQFNSLINSFSINISPGNINIDLMDENTAIYMPNLVYKGLFYK
jgi:hypothetical protein